MTPEFDIVGKDIPRTDAQLKATGAAMYTDDFKLPGNHCNQIAVGQTGLNLFIE